jgi:thymidylate synthase
MTEYRFRDINSALPVLMKSVMENGEELSSRNGKVQEILYPHIVLEESWRREIITPGRNASLPAQIAETMWVLAGRNDIGWLSNYLPRAAEFSDNGTTWRGAYGARLRKWRRREDSNDILDQLAWVVDLLKHDRATRRAIMSIYDPDTDSADGLDIPCNNWVHFLSRLGELHMHVTIRSNDLMWGFSGINAFEWSALQEIVAGLLGVKVGELHFSVSSLHIYDRHWRKAREIASQVSYPELREVKGSPRFDAATFGRSLDEFDALVDHWFQIEEELRTKGATERALRDIEFFPEPMLRSWLQVLAWWWGEVSLSVLEGTFLYEAALRSPRNTSIPDKDGVYKDAHDRFGTRRGVVYEATPPFIPAQLTTDAFVQFVSKLHEEKHAVYGDSWKKRGENGVLANIARKMDRLGDSGGGDTAADTAIDLLVYLIKYRLWITDYLPAAPALPDCLDGLGVEPFSNAAVYVTQYLQHIAAPEIFATADTIRELKALFARLELCRANGQVMTHPAIPAAGLVETMINLAFPLAKFLWVKELPHANA